LIANKGTAPMVAMPSLLGARVSSAIQFLERSNLKLGDTIFKPDFANGRILKQLANGDEIQPGTLVKYGTKVTLIIGSGVGSIIYNYPDFYGMTLQHALQVMDTLGLSRGAVSVDKGTKDSLRAYVYKQYPEAIDMFTRQPTLIRQGMTVDLFISNIRKPREIDTSASMISDEQLEEAKADDLKSQKEAGTEEKKDKKQTQKKKPTPKPAKAPAEVKPAPPLPKKDEYEG
jgi:beta-lactam-binding protein with PASTA domain